MEMQHKINILADSAKYDVSCSSSGSTRKAAPGGIGNSNLGGICHSWTSDGRCLSLLKILLSNDCAYNCAYCVNRASNDVPRASFTPKELADLTINFYRRNYIEGLFLSSAVLFNPDYTMESMIDAVRTLREDHHFNGYIHMKAIPGADTRLIEQAGKLVDRMSVNIELPSHQGLKLLAPQKKREAILQPMQFISSGISERNAEKKTRHRPPRFIPAGQTTQLMVGATPDHDLNIIRLSEGLYRKFSLKRVYYSAYIPVAEHPHLPALASPPLWREHRLYQADWLLRYYGFSADELLDESAPDLDPELDPKCHWALRNLSLFPIEINTADYEFLLRVPGIGVQSAKRIISARRVHSLTHDSLKRIGIVMKRARYFITCQGKFLGEKRDSSAVIRHQLLTKPLAGEKPLNTWEQLSLFSPSALSNYSDSDSKGLFLEQGAGK